MGTSRDEVIERFWSRVDQSAGPDACWPWAGASFNAHGYGVFSWCGRPTPASRVALMIKLGVEGINPNLYACHHCDNPPCCNPEHIYAGSARSNAIDRATRGGRIVRRTAIPDHVTPEIEARFRAAGLGELNDSKVAKALGLTKERVRQVRTALGIPAVGLRLCITADALKAAAAQHRTIKDIAAALGVGSQTVVASAAVYGVELPNGQGLRSAKHNWASVDWSLSNRQIAEALGINSQQVACHRWRKKLPPSPYPRRKTAA